MLSSVHEHMRCLMFILASFCFVVPGALADGSPPAVVSTSVCGVDRCVAAEEASLIAEVGFRTPPAIPRPTS
jgi:hypothetical protein